MKRRYLSYLCHTAIQTMITIAFTELSIHGLPYYVFNGAMEILSEYHLDKISSPIEGSLYEEKNSEPVAVR